MTSFINTDEIQKAKKNLVDTSYYNKIDWIGCDAQSACDIVHVIVSKFDELEKKYENQNDSIFCMLIQLQGLPILLGDND